MFFGVIDLNAILYYFRSFTSKPEGAPDEYAADRLFSDHGFLAAS